jgi:hypothetical protein
MQITKNKKMQNINCIVLQIIKYEITYNKKDTWYSNAIRMLQLLFSIIA